MITDEVKQMEVIIPLEVGGTAQEEFVLEIKENNFSTYENLNVKIQTLERFSRLKKSTRKKSASIL